MREPSGAAARGPAARALGPALFLISSSTLAFEVLLVRLFAIQTYYHFAHMVIGVALLGFGASGTGLVVARRWLRGQEQKLFRGAALALPLAFLAVPPLAATLEFEPTRLLWDPRQWLVVGVLYAVLAVPFLLAAACIALALMSAGARTGRLYAWNMVGSAAGALLGIALLFVAGVESALAGAALPAAVAVGLVWPGERRTGAASVIAWLGLTALLGSACLAAALRPTWTVRPSPFKGLPQVEAYPDARRVAEAWAPTGWVVAVETPAFRYAPGLSLGYGGAFPRQIALFVDGDVAGAATDWAGGGLSADPRSQAAGGSRSTAGSESQGGGPPEPGSEGAPYQSSEGAPVQSGAASEREPRLVDWLPTSSAFAVARPGRVLVLGSGGGLEVAVAIAVGVREVTAVELVRPLLQLADSVVPAGSRVYADPRVRAVVRDARSFVAGSRDRYDLVLLPASGGFQTTAAGIHGSGEDFLNTREAFGQYLDLLEDGGVLALTRWIRTPPREGVKLILTAGATLRARGIPDAGAAMVFLRSWATGTLLLKPAGFTEEDLASLRTFAATRFFDIDWPPPSQEEVRQFNALEHNVFREAAQAAAAGADSAAAYANGYPFRVSPATDDRPYFGRFLRLGSLPELLRQDRGTWLPFAEWGPLLLVATLVQSAALAVLLMGLPVLSLWWGMRGQAPAGAGVARVAAFFCLIGFGFVAVEIGAIQRLTLVLGHPVYAAAAVLAALLAFSGLGSAVSDRLEPGRLAPVCAAVAVATVVAGFLSPVAGVLASTSLPARTGVALLMVGGAGFLMGGPFPLGLRRLTPTGTGVAWAWAANGVASVVGTSLSVLVAMELGGRGLILAGACCYAGAALMARRGGS